MKTPSLAAKVSIAIFSWIFFHTACLSAEEDAANAKSRLIGDWQVGLREKTADAQTKEQYALSAGILGPVWRFKADNTLELYFPCDIDSRMKKGVQLSGTWRLDDDNTLYFRLSGISEETKGHGFKGKGKIKFDAAPYGHGTMVMVTSSMGKEDASMGNNGTGTLDVIAPGRDFQYGRFDESRVVCGK